MPSKPPAQEALAHDWQVCKDEGDAGSVSGGVGAAGGSVGTELDQGMDALVLVVGCAGGRWMGGTEWWSALDTWIVT